MAIIIHLDRMLTKREMKSKELAEIIGITTANLSILKSGKAKAITPNLASHFEDDMIVLEKWNPKKPLSAIYFDGDKERYYAKRFLIETEDKEEQFISEHPKSQLEIIAIDHRPMAEVQFSKRSLENVKINFEEFIAIKGIKAQGNQFSTDKIKQVNLLESLPYDEPRVEEVEVIEEEVIIEEKLPLEVPEVEVKQKVTVMSSEEKAQIALQKTIERKKAEQKAKDDENQQTLF